ncbi:hypothetical protein TrVFT333_001227 [Trichoderma virens FT-333]|nr:hypothetical protein TrVFT333_001227 [Trichoderma virens FT-333]
MKHANVLLFYASLLIECATAAVRSEILYHHQQRRFQSNTSIEIVHHGLSTAASTAAGATLSELADLTTKHDVLSISETASVPSTDNTTKRKAAAGSHVSTHRRGEQVIINSRTVSNLKPVVGLGSTITKPAPQATSPPIPAATSGTLGGIPVIVSGTQAVIDGNTVRIPPQEATTSINGQRVVLGAGTIAVGRETLILPSPQPTREIVTGGEMLTAIGTSLVVLHSTTITYGLNIAPNQTIINGETISIGPRGISLHGTTIGGPSANAKATEYEIVGGITVGKVLPSLVVVNGATYAINQDGDPNNFETTVIDNQTITIGPSGLVVSSQTLTYPGSSVTATLSSSNRALTPDFPVETGGHGNREDDDESGASPWRRDVSSGSLLHVNCIVMFHLIAVYDFLAVDANL